MLRSKPFLTYFLICAVPLLLLAALNYWNATRSVDNTVATIMQNDLNSFTTVVDQILDEQGKKVLQIASHAPVYKAPTFVYDYTLFNSLNILDRKSTTSELQSHSFISYA